MLPTWLWVKISTYLHLGDISLNCIYASSCRYNLLLSSLLLLVLLLLL
jgi:cation transporter-like permease